MDQFENNLRDALREPEPPVYLAGKVMAGVAARQKRSVTSRHSWFIAAAAAVLALAAGSIALFQNTLFGTQAVVERSDGSTHRVAFGETVRSDDGAVLTLGDGSRVEMRSGSELALQSPQDGVLLQLNGGSIIVTAAKQRSGHLYVRTKDVTVSVVGTVFVVNAEEGGSRVAVLQGEVQVQQGATAKKLRPGEQVATNPLMVSPPVIEEILWSRNAAALVATLQQSLALLQQPVVVPLPASPANAPEARIAFEVASVRPMNPASDGAGRGWNLPFGFGCGGGFMQLDPSRLVITTNLFSLVAMAYGKDCVSMATYELLSGGPAWVRSDQFTIQAIIPEGSPVYSRRQFMDGSAPRLQTMLQTLLENRFKLAVHRETKQMAVYALTVAKSGQKLTPFQEAACDSVSTPVLPAFRTPDQKPACGRGFNVNRQGHFNVWADGATLEGFAQLLTGALDRPVIDRTGIMGVFDFHLESSVEGTMFRNFPFKPADSPPYLFNAIEQQLGLRLESVKGPVEALIIDRAEKPAEN